MNNDRIFPREIYGIKSLRHEVCNVTIASFIPNPEMSAINKSANSRRLTQVFKAYGIGYTGEQIPFGSGRYTPLRVVKAFRREGIRLSNIEYGAKEKASAVSNLQALKNLLTAHSKLTPEQKTEIEESWKTYTVETKNEASVLVFP